MAKRIFTSTGSELDDIQLIRDDETLYVSCGEGFKKIECDTSRQCDDWITLNVGGRHFTTTRSTLTRKEPDSMLGRMFAADSRVAPSPRDSTGAYLIDRSPEYFEPIIGWLRHGDLVLNEGVNPRGVLEEVRFYGVQSLVGVLESIVERESLTELELSARPLTRRDVINALIGTSCSTELRFQGVNLCGADLSKVSLPLFTCMVITSSSLNLVGSEVHQLQIRTTTRSEPHGCQSVLFDS